jgi:hypothetical protein
MCEEHTKVESLLLVKDRIRAACADATSPSFPRVPLQFSLPPSQLFFLYQSASRANKNRIALESKSPKHECFLPMPRGREHSEGSMRPRIQAHVSLRVCTGHSQQPSHQLMLKLQNASGEKANPGVDPVGQVIDVSHLCWSDSPRG